jgi:CopG family transcriptional regulator, nickel-responsive regulator
VRIGKNGRRQVSRISISLPHDLLAELDSMVGQRGCDSRSQAINDMVHRGLMEHKHQLGDDVMVGIITLFYDNSVHGLQKALADLQFRYIDEVISSLHVHLMHDQTMEVILVQGPARDLQAIADEMTSRRGVKSGRMHLVTALIPQLHPFNHRGKSKQAKGKHVRSKQEKKQAKGAVT